MAFDAIKSVKGLRPATLRRHLFLFFNVLFLSLSVVVVVVVVVVVETVVVVVAAAAA